MNTDRRARCNKSPQLTPLEAQIAGWIGECAAEGTQVRVAYSAGDGPPVVWDPASKVTPSTSRRIAFQAIRVQAQSVERRLRAQGSRRRGSRCRESRPMGGRRRQTQRSSARSGDSGGDGPNSSPGDEGPRPPLDLELHPTYGPLNAALAALLREWGE